ncbi:MULTISPECIES: hypothetical protein [Streptomyces]|uniref:Uncharacterized protein n=1 Tax=Streptomyces dengpaensis TaxID=2049881 RepID=A0ABM6T3N7_9ACTN|nr:MULTISPECIES: hypothetical protein [Streptomyces]AVH61715.1 hypothetical protein C4B68_40080 [Streptomyces dengpaensis]PIB05078.1 hypothetical protein B1C81_30705 [Streptomyces sp. HG99]
MTALPPRTTWEYSLSAAEELVTWHLAHSQEPPPDGRETTVLLAAAVHALAAGAGLSGPQVASLLLAAPAGQDSVLNTLQGHVLSALQDSPADALGSSEREQLLAAYGTGEFTAVQEAAQRVLHHHVQDADGHGQPHPTIRDRAHSMADARHQQLLKDLARVQVEPW